MSQPGNWEIDLIVQRIGAYDLNHSFDAALGATSARDNTVDMSEHMNMHMEDQEAGTTMTDASIEATEDELGPPSSPPPASDSFAWLAIGLSIAVGAASTYYFRKSKQQLEGTLKTLEG
ncbi:MAG: hypothetical protein M3218_04725 [Thermoproteota archaeon]|nr:hypothetical protein [Thermoproteota archaeon]